MKKIIIANWKMNPITLKEARKLFESIRRKLKNLKNTEVVICPPFVYLSLFQARLPSVAFNVGGQDCFWQEKGAFTGEVSAKMLKDLGVKYVIVGHSERKRIFGETNEIVNKKIKAILKENLVPIVFVGETKKEREKGETFKVLKGQIEKRLKGIPKSGIKKITFTYEPIWAISPNPPCSVDDALTAILFIRKVISKLFNQKIARNIKIFYGGSVNSNNVSNFLREQEIDGVVVGAASLDSEEFAKIIKSANIR